MSFPIYQAGRYEYIEGTSAKFWECLMEGDGSYRIRWGKIGTKGQTMATRLSRQQAAERADEKRRKGYKHVESTIQTIIDLERKALIDVLPSAEDLAPAPPTRRVRL